MSNLNQIHNKIVFGGKILLNSFKGPSALVLESSSFCQADCLMCSRERLDRQKGNMTFGLFKKAVDEARQLKISIIQLSFYGEPLLDPDIEAKLEYLRNEMPSVTIVMNTNGELLNEAVIRTLLSNKLNEIRISIEGNGPTDYNNIRRKLSFDTLIRNLTILRKLRDEYKSDTSIVIWSRSLESNPIQTLEFRAFWSKYADKIFIDHENKYLLAAKETFIQKVFPCIRVFGFLVVLSDGRVSMCDSDWYGKYTLGNLYTQTLKEIWFSGKLVRNRALNIFGLKKIISFCRECPYRPFYTYFQNKEFANYQYK